MRKVYLDEGARYGYAAQKENGKERQALRRISLED